MNVPFGKGIYSKGGSSLTYAKLLLLAQQELEKGASVILDATFGNKHLRHEALRLARDRDANIVFVECFSPASVSKSRLIKRNTKPSFSDARLRHFEHFKKHFEPLNEIKDEMHIRIDTARLLEESIQKILSHGNIISDRKDTQVVKSSRSLAKDHIYRNRFRRVKSG